MDNLPQFPAVPLRTKLSLGVKLHGIREDTVKVDCVRTTAQIMELVRTTIIASALLGWMVSLSGQDQIAL